MTQKKIEVVIQRGGTSKGIFIKEENLPKKQEDRDKLILRIFGSPDIRQIDGLGGAEPLTSKLAIVGVSDNPNYDLNYTFGQVSYVDAKVDYSGNCGNISSGVGPFAIDEGMVNINEPYTTVKIFNTNTGKILKETVEVLENKAKVSGNYKIDGVPGTGSKVLIDFSGTAGSKTGKLLPTGNVKDKINLSGLGEVEVSLVDAANPMVFVKAKDIGLGGIESPSEIDENINTLNRLEELRGKAAEMIGMVENWEDAKNICPAFPMVAFVSPSNNYEAYGTKENINISQIDFVSRLMFMQVIHKTYAGTGTICTGAAARIEGTVVNEVMGKNHKNDNDIINIGHPSGVISIEVAAQKTDEEWVLEKAIIGRTSRRIMEGYCFVPNQ